MEQIVTLFHSTYILRKGNSRAHIISNFSLINKQKFIWYILRKGNF